MKEITRYYIDKNILFKSIKEILPKEIGSRKKIKIYIATSIKSEYYAIFIVEQKSRFIKKHSEDLLELCDKLASYIGHNFKKKELLITSPLCSKAKKTLKEAGFKIETNIK